MISRVKLSCTFLGDYIVSYPKDELEEVARGWGVVVERVEVIMSP